MRSLGRIPNRPESVGRLIRKLGKPEQLRVCYEAGPTGYVLYWQLSELGVKCEVVAPTLIPMKAGDRVKTDRRDAEKLARCYRSGDLTAVWVPDAAHEALRDLVRARETAKKDQLRARHRLGKFLPKCVARLAFGEPQLRPVLEPPVALRTQNQAVRRNVDGEPGAPIGERPWSAMEGSCEQTGIVFHHGLADHSRRDGHPFRPGAATAPPYH